MDYIKKLQDIRRRDRRIIATLTKTNGKGQAKLARRLNMSRQLVNVIWKKWRGEQ